MRKLFLNLFLLTAIAMNAQFTPRTDVNYVKFLKTPATVSGEDYTGYFVLMYNEADKFMYKVPSDALGQFIPLSGTEVDKPVTGEILINEPFGIRWKGADYPNNYHGIQGGEGGASLYSRDDVTGAMSFVSVGTSGVVIHQTEDGVNVGESHGLMSNFDYTANITDLDYTQKKYVDDAIAAAGGGTITEVTGTANEVDVASGTGPTVVIGLPDDVAISGTLEALNLSGTNTGDNAANTNSGLVHTSGTETIAGVKTFSSTIVGSINGNAATSTALQTPRTINGTSFDGTANITVTAAAGTLTGTTLNSTVTASSLTSVGTLANLTVTNPIVGSVTGNAATVTTNANLTGAITSTGNATSLGSFTSSNLLGALSDETGTGASVFAGSPTFTGTPAAPTAAVTVDNTQIATTEHVKDVLNYVTPEMYGAVGDGVTNDATAMQNCINAGFPILLGAKTYLINTSLTTGTLMYMQGTGYKSILRTTANISIITINGDNNVIKNVSFSGNSSGASQRGIQAVGVVGLTTYRISNIISECRFVNLNVDGIYSQYMIGLSTGSQHQGALYVDSCVFNNCGYGFRADTRAEYNTLNNCVFYLCQVGVSFTGGNNNIIGGQITDCTTTGIEILSGANDGHSSAVGVKINHNVINVKCTHANNWVFDGCAIYSGNITLTGTGKTIFDACQFSMGSNTLTITNSPATFNNCEFAAVPGTYTLTGAKPTMDNTYNGTSRLVTPILAGSDYTAKTANYTATAADKYIDCTANSFTLTLPTAVGITGYPYTVKNSGTGVVTMAATSSQTFDGSASKTLEPNSVYTFTSNGANWEISSSYVETITVNATAVAFTNATLNSTYPNVTVGYRVLCPNVGTSMGYIKATEAGSADVWLSAATSIVP